MMEKATGSRVLAIEGGPRCAVQPGDTVLKAALRAAVGMPYECSVGSCGSCKFELVEGEVEDTWPGAPGLSARDRQRGKRLGCQSLPIGDVHIKVRIDETYIPPIVPRRFEARLECVADVTHDMREFTFRSSEAARFLPGQYALVQLPGLGTQRAYSMSNLPNKEGLWQFIIRRVPNGAGSGYLFDHLTVRSTVELDGPYGLAFIRPPTRDIVCIAGGSGLAPMLAIARAAAPLLQDAGIHLKFYFGARTSEDLAAKRMLSTCDSIADRISCVEVVSQPSGDGEWRGPTGFVHEAVDAGVGEHLAAHDVYLAGPPAMVQASLDLLMVQRRVPPSQIHFDRFF